MDAPSQLENFNHPNTICPTYLGEMASRFHWAGRNTLHILRIKIRASPQKNRPALLSPPQGGRTAKFNRASISLGRHGNGAKGKCFVKVSYQYYARSSRYRVRTCPNNWVPSTKTFSSKSKYREWRPCCKPLIGSWHPSPTITPLHF